MTTESMKEKSQFDKIKSRESLLSTITDSVPGYVSLFDSELNYLEVNQELLKALGVTPQQIIGKPLQFRNQKNALIQFIEEFRSSHSISIKKKLLYSIDPRNSPKWYFSTLTRGAAGEIVCVSLDIDEQERNEKIIQEQQEKIIHTKHLAEVGELLGGVAHEINNPLQAIVTTIEALSRKLTDGSLPLEEGQKYFERLKKYTYRIQKIVAGLKNQVRQGDRDPFELFNVAEVIDEAVLILGHKLKDKSIDVKIDVPQDITILGRSIQIGQIVLNLVNNSIEAIETLPEKWIRISAIKSDSIIGLRVMDSGPGIPDEILDKIMQPFFTTKGVGVGTGMGLSIFDKIAKEHGGNLKVIKTFPNTCFELSLPKPSNQPTIEHKA